MRLAVDGLDRTGSEIHRLRFLIRKIVPCHKEDAKVTHTDKDPPKEHRFGRLGYLRLEGHLGDPCMGLWKRSSPGRRACDTQLHLMPAL